MISTSLSLRTLTHMLSLLLLTLTLTLTLPPTHASYNTHACSAPSLSTPFPLPPLSSSLLPLRLHTLVRHGDRTPSVWLFSRAYDAHWTCSLMPHATGSSPDLLSPSSARSFVFANTGWPAGNCSSSWLTQKGSRQLYSLGASIAQAWILRSPDSSTTTSNPEATTSTSNPEANSVEDRNDAYGWGGTSLGDVIVAARNLKRQPIALRSTDVPRTKFSLTSFWAGVDSVTSAHPLGPIDPAADVLTYLGSDDSLQPGVGNSCSAFGKLNEATRNGDVMRTYMESVADKVAEIDHVFADILNISLPFSDPNYNWQYLMDNIQARICHDKILPDVVTPQLFQDIDDIASTRWQIQINAPNAVRLGYASLFADLVAEFQAIRDGNLDSLPPPITFWSAHDSTVAYVMAGLRAGMGGFNGVWPPYASNLHLLTLRHNVTGSLYVLPLYNGDILDIPCNLNVTHPIPGLCTISDFISLLNTTALAPDAYAAACRVPPSPPSPPPGPSPSPSPSSLDRAVSGGLLGGFLGLVFGIAIGIAATLFASKRWRTSSDRSPATPLLPNNSS